MRQETQRTLFCSDVFWGLHLQQRLHARGIRADGVIFDNMPQSCDASLSELAFLPVDGQPVLLRSRDEARQVGIMLFF